MSKIMTVFDLIRHLQELPPKTKVVVRGYEDGYNNILQLKQIKIKPKTNGWWNGEYE